MSKWMTKGESGRQSYLSSAAPSVRLFLLRPSRMLTGKSAIPIDAAMHKRSAENVSTMANGGGGAEEGRRLLKPALLCCAGDYVSGVDTANKWKENRSERLMSVGPPSLLLPPLASSKERNLLISRIPPHLTFPSSGGVFSEGASQFLRGISFHEKRDRERGEGERGEMGSEIGFVNLS